MTSAGLALLGLLFGYEAGRSAIELRLTGDRGIGASHELFEFESVPVRIASPGAEEGHGKDWRSFAWCPCLAQKRSTDP